MSSNTNTLMPKAMKPKATTPNARNAHHNTEAGFTLAEALIATLVLMFGLASIFNLMITATTSNNVANRASAASMIAAQQLEVLRATPFSQLVDTATSLDDPCDPGAPVNCSFIEVEGVGSMETRWIIQTLTNPNLRFLQVRTEPRGFRARQAMADLTTIRSCTLGTAAGCN